MYNNFFQFTSQNDYFFLSFLLPLLLGVIFVTFVQFRKEILGFGFVLCYISSTLNEIIILKNDKN